MKKKIMIFIPSLAGGGAERTIVNIINYINKDKYEIILVMLKNVTKKHQENRYLHLVENNCQIKYLNVNFKLTSIFNIIYKLAICIRKVRPDLIFSTIYKANILTYLANVVSLTSTPIILRESNHRTAERIPGFYKYILKIIYPKADGIIALSQGVAEDLKVNFGVEDEKISVIYNPIDIKKINKLKDCRIEENIRRNKNEKVIISVGRLTDQKDYPTLINAFNLVLKEIDCQLVILGEGELENKLKKLVEDMKITNKVHFLGFKSNPYSYMNKSDLFVLSSKFEGFGHVIVEAMAVGLPVVSSNCMSGPSEILKNGEYGDLFNVGDYQELSSKIIKNLKNKKLREERIKKGLLRVEKFNASTIVKQYEDKFDEVINKD